MDLRTFVQELREAGDFDNIMLNQAAQFGTQNQPYLGSRFLPERPSDNQFTERGIRYMTVVASPGTRFSTPTKKQGQRMVGQFDVKLGESDIERDLLPEDYDALVQFFNQSGDMRTAAENTIMDFTDRAINLSLIEFNEIQRWQYFIEGRLVINLPRGGQEIVDYPDPDGGGHRVSAGGNWSDDSYDPMTDISAQASVLRDKGYQIFAIVTSNNVLDILAGNDQIKQQGGGFITTPSETNTSGLEMFFTSNQRAVVNSAFANHGLPQPIAYDRHYNTQTGRERFLPEDAMVFIGRGREVEYENEQNPEDVRFLPSVLGYTAIGTPVGQSRRGRAIDVQPHTDKPPRVEMQGWQTSLPVPQEPEAVASIDNIA